VIELFSRKRAPFYLLAEKEPYFGKALLQSANRVPMAKHYEQPGHHQTNQVFVTLVFSVRKVLLAWIALTRAQRSGRLIAKP
jgi:hypothetical protein